MRIPFNKPECMGNEIKYMRDAVLRGKLSGDGYYCDKASRWLEKKLRVHRTLLTPSATHALELAAILIDIKPGDEVILPSFTFTSTANAFVLRGARPVFVDIRQDTLNIDEKLIEEKISRSTKALTLIHYAGLACEMKTICEIINTNRLLLIEDAAQAIGAKYNGKYLGTFGQMSALSFHETKNIYCGEGGALLLNDGRYVKRAEIIREKGTNRSQFFRGEARKYEWMDIGSSYILSDLSAAFLYGQLEEFNNIMRKRKIQFGNYMSGLSDLEKKGHFRLPVETQHVESNYHTFYILLPTLSLRNKLEDSLRRKSILAVSHYMPLHLSPMGKSFGYKKGDFPVTEKTADTILRLPLYYNLYPDNQEYIIKAIRKFFLD